MIELHDDSLRFRAPEVHADATLAIDFQRTLRIPDDDKDYPLPPGLGRFPMKHVDDFAEGIPPGWLEHGGVMLPMYQSEALWLNFNGAYPFAITIAAGKINAVTGDAWTGEFGREPQNYVVVPEQPWLDGYCVEKGVIRQFVAMPLGAGYTAEEQLTGAADHGGIQILAAPMKRDAYERIKEARRLSLPAEYESLLACAPQMSGTMGLAPGGRMRQEIYHDPHDFDAWDFAHTSRCFVHLANSLVWRQITGDAAPTVPPTAKEYAAAGLPWFEVYAEKATAVEGSKKLAWLKSIVQMAKKKGDVPLPENQSVTPSKVVELRKGLKAGQAR